MPLEHDNSYHITMDALISSMRKLMPYLRDKKVFEIYCNEDGLVRTDTLGKGRTPSETVLTEPERRQIIFNIAALTNQIISNEKPCLDADIPSNAFFPKCRFEGNLPDIVSAPTLNIRKHPEKIFTLDDYVEEGIMTKHQRDIIKKAIKEKKNIIAAGGTKSGKTTLLNAILAEISKYDDRVIIIEDTPELQCSAKDKVQMRATRTFTMADCLHQVLRMTPDRIVVGEVRGGEALDLLEAWFTGHPGGCSTVHSNSATDTLLRLQNMTARVSKNPQQDTIVRAVNIIVYLKYSGGSRKIEQIISVDGYDANKHAYLIHEIK